MQDQPRTKPYRASPFFRDGMSSRPLVEGTVARGYLHEDTEFFTGKKRATGPSTPAGSGSTLFPDDVELFPIAVTEEVVRRGKERFEIFCSVCHGQTGYGDGMVVRRGFRPAASFHDDRLRDAPVGHYFDVMTNGWGAMPSYATQIPVQDRWAIIAYIRALQLSQPKVQNQADQSTPAAKPAGEANAPTGGGQEAK
jgi:mono/diheme cytochrome c family protein